MQINCHLYDKRYNISLKCDISYIFQKLKETTITEQKYEDFHYI